MDKQMVIPGLESLAPKVEKPPKKKPPKPKPPRVPRVVKPKPPTIRQQMAALQGKVIKLDVEVTLLRLEVEGDGSHG